MQCILVEYSVAHRVQCSSQCSVAHKVQRCSEKGCSEAQCKIITLMARACLSTCQPCQFAATLSQPHIPVHCDRQDFTVAGGKNPALLYHCRRLHQSPVRRLDLPIRGCHEAITTSGREAQITSALYAAALCHLLNITNNSIPPEVGKMMIDYLLPLSKPST
jgi:hypothetical protein